MVKRRYPNSEWRITFDAYTEFYVQSREAVVDDNWEGDLKQYHSLKKFSNRLDQLYEKTYNCRILWNEVEFGTGLVYSALQFNSEESYVWFKLRWL